MTDHPESHATGEEEERPAPGTMAPPSKRSPTNDTPQEPKKASLGVNVGDDTTPADR